MCGGVRLCEEVGVRKCIQFVHVHYVSRVRVCVSVCVCGGGGLRLCGKVCVRKCISVCTLRIIISPRVSVEGGGVGMY